MNEEDIRTFVEAAKSTPYYAFFHLLLYTGLRRSEALALRWSDVDLLLGQVSVSRSLHLVRGELIFRSPKTAKGRRVVALPPSATLVLREHRKQQEAMSATLGTSLEDSSLVFCHLDGTPLRPDIVTHAWVKLERKTGIDGVRLHDARHTHASLMLKHRGFTQRSFKNA